MVFGCCESLSFRSRVCICMLMVADYVKQGVVVISRAFWRVGEIEGLRKGK